MSSLWVRLKDPVGGQFNDVANGIYMRGKTPVEVTLPNARVHAALQSGILIELSTAEKNRIQEEISDETERLASAQQDALGKRKEFTDVQSGDKVPGITREEKEAELKALSYQELKTLAETLAAAQEPPESLPDSRTKKDLIPFILDLYEPFPLAVPD